MRLFGKKIIPGVKIEVDTDNTDDASNNKNGGKKDTLDIVSNHSEQSATTYDPNSEETTNNECDDYDEDNFETALESFEAYTRIKRSKRATEEVLHGTDWESVNYSLTKLQCNEDEITGLCVNDKYLVVQCHIEGGIDVYDRVTLKHLYRLNGHEYGGQCVELSGDDILYSASMDFSLKSWNLETQKQIDSATDHCDYVQCLAVKTGEFDMIATGGRGDREIFVYKASKAGKFTKQHCLRGHTGWIIQLLFDTENHLLSGSEDATIRLWHVGSGEMIHVISQDAGISCLAASKLKNKQDNVILFGDREGKLSYLDLETLQVLHLLPNILIGTGKYCRSSKYHDKAVDNAFLTDNGYLITVSAGSKFLKIWKIKTFLEYGYTEEDELPEFDLESTEVRELQILRDHTDYLTCIKVFGNTIYSSCSDGEIYMHSFPDEGTFPHYEMAVDADDDTASAVMLDKKGTGVVARPESATELCVGPGRCRTGKTGIEKSSSSFQVSFSFKKCSSSTTLSVDGKLKLKPKHDVKNDVIFEEDDEEWDPDDDDSSNDSSDDPNDYTYTSDDSDLGEFENSD